MFNIQDTKNAKNHIFTLHMSTKKDKVFSGKGQSQFSNRPQDDDDMISLEE